MMNFLIREAIIEDAKQIHDIYDYYVKNTNITFTTQNPSVDDYKEKIEKTKQDYPFLVACIGNEICGFVYGSQIRPHEAYRWGVESTIYLSQAAPKRMGVATKLYVEFLELLKIQGYKCVYGVITASNNASIEMHNKLGFEKIGYFKNMGYKNENWHDVVWMQKNLSNFEKHPLQPKSLQNHK